MTIREQAARQLQKDWAENPRWQGIKRDYSAEDVVRLRGSLAVEHTLARRGAESSGVCSTASPSSTHWAP